MSWKEAKVIIKNVLKDDTNGLSEQLEQALSTALQALDIMGKVEEEITPEQLHRWYLEAIKKISPKSYNPNAIKEYSELDEDQKDIDRYIASKIQIVLAQKEKRIRELTEKVKQEDDDCILTCVEIAQRDKEIRDLSNSAQFRRIELLKQMEEKEKRIGELIDKLRVEEEMRSELELRLAQKKEG